MVTFIVGLCFLKFVTYPTSDSICAVGTDALSGEPYPIAVSHPGWTSILLVLVLNVYNIFTISKRALHSPSMSMKKNAARCIIGYLWCLFLAFFCEMLEHIFVLRQTSLWDVSWLACLLLLVVANHFTMDYALSEQASASPFIWPLVCRLPSKESAAGKQGMCECYCRV